MLKQHERLKFPLHCPTAFQRDGREQSRETGLLCDRIMYGNAAVCLSASIPESEGREA